MPETGRRSANVHLSCAVQTYDVAAIISVMTLFTFRVLAPLKASDPDR